MWLKIQFSILWITLASIQSAESIGKTQQLNFEQNLILKFF